MRGASRGDGPVRGLLREVDRCGGSSGRWAGAEATRGGGPVRGATQGSGPVRGVPGGGPVRGTPLLGGPERVSLSCFKRTERDLSLRVASTGLDLFRPGPPVGGGGGRNGPRPSTSPRPTPSPRPAVLGPGGRGRVQRGGRTSGVAAGPASAGKSSRTTASRVVSGTRAGRSGYACQGFPGQVQPLGHHVLDGGGIPCVPLP